MHSPASRQMSTRRVASSTPVLPHALKNSFVPPNVPVPIVKTGTLKPDPPSSLCSILFVFYRTIRQEAGPSNGVCGATENQASARPSRRAEGPGEADRILVQDGVAALAGGAQHGRPRRDCAVGRLVGAVILNIDLAGVGAVGIICYGKNPGRTILWMRGSLPGA